MSVYYYSLLAVLAVCLFTLFVSIRRRDWDTASAAFVGILWVLLGLMVARVWNA